MEAGEIVLKYPDSDNRHWKEQQEIQEYCEAIREDLGGAFMIAVLLVVVGAKQILINTLGTAFFFRLHLTIVPCVLMIPILVGIAYVIPKYQFEKMSRESVVERIRKE